MGCGSKHFLLVFFSVPPFSGNFPLFRSIPFRYCFISGFIFGRNMILVSCVLLFVFSPVHKCILGLDVSDCSVRFEGRGMFLVGARACIEQIKSSIAIVHVAVFFLLPLLGIRLMGKPKWLMGMWTAVLTCQWNLFFFCSRFILLIIYDLIEWDQCRLASLVHKSSWAFLSLSSPSSSLMSSSFNHTFHLRLLNRFGWIDMWKSIRAKKKQTTEQATSNSTETVWICFASSFH